MKTIDFIRFTTLFISTLIVFTSCSRSNDPMANLSSGTVTVNVSGETFETENRSSARNATPYLQSDDLDVVQRNTTKINDNLIMIAELSAEDPSQMDIQQSLKDGTKAAISNDTSGLATGIAYRVLVFNANTQVYVTQRDYTRGTEPSPGNLLLDGGTTYTFVVYSLNTQAALPALTVPAGTTLNNLSINVAGNRDFMYFRQNLAVVGGATNRLDIVLKHRFSQITTVINSSNTGYNITSITSNFKPHATNTNVALATGNFTGTASSAGSPVTFNSLNAETVTSVPTIIANTSGNNAGSYTISSMTIGPLTQTTNLVPFPNLVVQPGVRYTLRLTYITTEDADLGIYNGQPAVRINGVIWAKQNLGATSTNPAVVSQSSFGNYYQYGSNSVVGTEASTSLSTSTSYITFAAEPEAKAWNSGTEAVPQKTGADPCPAGYRVPTQTEFTSLLNGVSQFPVGTFTTNTDYNNYILMISLRKRDVTLNLPAIGALAVTYSSGASNYNRVGRGNPVSARYHTSSSELRGDAPYRWLAINNSTSKTAIVGSTTNNRSAKYVGGNIRCVGIPNP